LSLPKNQSRLNAVGKFSDRNEDPMSSTSFWNDFAAPADSWAREMHSGNERKVFDAIDELLQRHDISYCFDITVNDGDCLLIFSPEGDPDVGKSIDRFLANAPSSTTWRFFGRRAKKDLHDAAAIARNLYLIDPRETRFRVREGKQGPVVEMIVPSSADLSADEARGMINTFLWHAIGEEKVMTEHIDGHVSFDDKPDEPTVSASEMVAVVERWIP
jgi:hypothetical protein